MLRLGCLVLLVPAAFAGPSADELLARVGEEAGAMQQNLPNAVSQETLSQKALLPPSRFRPRIGSGAETSVAPRFLVREIISEYSVGALKGSTSQTLVEYRQVLSVDGKQLQSEEKARLALATGIKSLDDRLRRSMLEELAHYGLVDVATDYGLLLLAFTRSGQRELEIHPAGQDRLGAEMAQVFEWRQNSASRGELEFHGRQAARHALAGRLWVRASDGVPLRIDAWTEHPQSGHTYRDEAAVEYMMSAHGFLVPASVVYRHSVDGQQITENHHSYAPFQIFSANTEIKFDELPSPPK